MMKLPRRDFLRLAVGAAAVPAISRTSSGQNYPSRPIRLVVPFPPGGAFDTLGRPLADKIKPLLGTMVIENIGGGGSSLGASAVAHAPPDGYTLLLGGTLPHVNEALLKSRPLYDPIKDLEPVSNVAFNFLSIAVHPSLPVQTLKQLVDYAKANPGKLSYGHVGIGSTNHLTGELFKSLTGTPEILQIPYRGAGPAIADLISGHIPMAVVAVTGQVIELHRSGKLRVLVVTGAKRLIAGPEFPTATEAGLAGMTVTASLGLLAPARTPRPIIDQIAQATRMALNDQTFQQKLIELGFEPDLNSTPEAFRRSLEEDIAQWRPVVKALDLKID
jgi:tripartite-type tricarboxylate transporter receptor subunit TctC